MLNFDEFVDLPEVVTLVAKFEVVLVRPFLHSGVIYLTFCI